MKIGDTVYFSRDNKICSGKLIAIDGDPSEPNGYVAQSGQSVHWLMDGDVYVTRTATGCALLTRLRRYRTDALKRAREEAEKVESLDEQITELIRAFK